MSDLSTRSIYSVFAEAAERRPEHPAVIYLGSRFSYRRVKQLAEAFAAGLAGLDEALKLTGQTLMVAGSSTKVGEGKVKLLRNAGTLYARFVSCTACENEEVFLSRIVQEMRELGIQFKKVIAGKENIVATHEGPLVTRSLMVGDLKPGDSVALQEAGVGSHRKLGCGLFIPHKTV